MCADNLRVERPKLLSAIIALKIMVANFMNEAQN